MFTGALPASFSSVALGGGHENFPNLGLRRSTFGNHHGVPAPSKAPATSTALFSKVETVIDTHERGRRSLPGTHRMGFERRNVMKKRLFIPIIATGLLIAACGGATEDDTTSAQPTVAAAETTAVPEASEAPVEDDPIVNDLGETAAQELSVRIIEQAQEVIAGGYAGHSLDTPCAALKMYHTRTSISRVIAGSDGKGPMNDTYVEIMFAKGDTGRATQKEYASLPYEDKVWVAGEYIDWLCGV